MELKTLKCELEDEKKKNEDLQFKIEEDEVMRGGEDTELLEKIKHLEEQLKNAGKNEEGSKNEFEARIKSLENELGIQRKISVNHQSVVEQLNGLTLELESERRSKAELQSQLELKVKEMDETSNKLFEAEEQLAQLNVTLEASEANLEREKAKLTTVNENIKNKEDSSIEKISDLEKKLSEKDDIILEFEHKIETLQRSDFDHSNIIEEKVEELKLKATEIQDMKLAMVKLESELKSSLAQVGSLQAQFDDSRGNIQELEKQLKAAKEEINKTERNAQANAKIK